MPEASVYEDHRMVLREDKIRPSRQASILETVAQSPSMESATNEHFWLGIPSADSAHVELPLLWGQHISHRLSHG